MRSSAHSLGEADAGIVAELPPGLLDAERHVHAVDVDLVLREYRARPWLSDLVFGAMIVLRLPVPGKAADVRRRQGTAYRAGCPGPSRDDRDRPQRPARPRVAKQPQDLVDGGGTSPDRTPCRRDLLGAHVRQRQVGVAEGAGVCLDE